MHSASRLTVRCLTLGRQIWRTLNDGRTTKERIRSGIPSTSAARSRDIELPAGFFIQEVLGARDIATSMNYRQNNRERYRKYAAQMEEIANVLRKRLPNRLPLMPTGEELAGRLEAAARRYRDYVAVARNETRGMNWTRELKPLQVFMSLLSNDLKGISGKWLDDEVAVLTEIAFDKSEIDTDRVIWARRVPNVIGMLTKAPNNLHNPYKHRSGCALDR